MLDKMSWIMFEKTGNIDAYLLYINLKNLSNSGENGSKKSGDKSRFTG